MIFQPERWRAMVFRARPRARAKREPEELVQKFAEVQRWTKTNNTGARLKPLP
jgi:hypothetical protein